MCHAYPQWTFHIAAIFAYRCLRIVISYGPTHSLKGDSAGPEVTIYLQNYRLFSRILLKPDLAIGKNHWLARVGLADAL